MPSRLGGSFREHRPRRHGLEPRPASRDASAQAAGELFQRPEVRAVYVTEDEKLVGVVTRNTLVRGVIARGLDPKATELRAIAEAPHFTIGPDVQLEEAFRFLEAEDAERVPVVDEHDRLVGVLSRSVLQRRLAEDEDEPLPPAA